MAAVGKQPTLGEFRFIRIASIARVTEISSTSPDSFDDATRRGIDGASKTLRGFTSAWVKDQNVMIDNGQITAFRVNLAVTFVLDD